MIGYDLTEEPTLVAQKIYNPFNILGVYIGFYLMKLGFGYAALLIPIILATISFYLISNFSFNLSKRPNTNVVARNISIIFILHFIWGDY